MVQYRRLTGEELKELELEFKQFLISNGIYDLEWKKLNVASPEKAQDLVDLFSDVVMEKALTKIEFIARKTNKNIDVFHFGRENVGLISLSSQGENIDFLNNDWASQLPLYAKEVKYFKVEKKIQNRPKEIFQLLSSGCEIVEAYFYNTLSKLTENG